MAAGITAAPSSITNLRALGNAQPAAINRPESQPPNM